MDIIAVNGDIADGYYDCPAMCAAMSRSLVDQFILRLPPGLRERVRAAAEANQRSMNTEIVTTLLEAYPAPETPLEATLTKLEAVIADVRAGRVPLTEGDGAWSEGKGPTELLDRLTKAVHDDAGKA